MIPAVEIMASKILAKGHEIVKEEHADIVIVASCALTQEIMRNCLSRAQQASTMGKNVLIIGCLPEIGEENILRVVPSASIAGVNSYHHIEDILKKMEERYRVRRLNDPPRMPLSTAVWRRVNPLTAYIPIGEGCSRRCEFCICRITRGSQISYPPESIINAVVRAVENNAREIVLVSEDAGAYGRDIGIALPSLLRKIFTIKGDFKIRLGYVNPASILPYFDDLLSCLSHPKMYRFLHLNIQSASQKVLDGMRRDYTPEDIAMIFNRLRKEFNGFTIISDILVGHPAEDDEDFEETLEFLKKLKPDSINVYAYSPHRGGGDSSQPSWKVKQRYEEMLALKSRLEIESSKRWIGWRGEVTVIQNDGNIALGRNYAYRDVVFKSSLTPGEKTKVEIKNHKGYTLLA